MAVSGKQGTVELSTYRRLNLWVKSNKINIFISCWFVAYLLGYLGFRDHLVGKGAYSSWDFNYLALQLFILKSGDVFGDVNWKLQLARLMAPTLTFSTAVLGIVGIYRERMKLLKVNYLKKHVIICGLGRKGLLFTERFISRGFEVIVIEQDKDNHLVDRCSEAGGLVLFGNATDALLLHKARVDKAQYLISVCGDDGANAEVAVHAREIVQRRKGKPLHCLVHITDPQLCLLLKQSEIHKGKRDNFRLEFFNVFDSGSKMLLEEFPPEHTESQSQSDPLHFIIIGLGRLGESLTVNLSRKLHKNNGTSGNKARITVIDRDAGRKMKSICMRYPTLETMSDLVALDMDVRSPEFQEAAFLFNKDACEVTKIFICLDNESLGMTTALILRDKLLSCTVPIIIRMVHDSGLSSLIGKNAPQHYLFRDLYAFGLLDHTCTEETVLHGTFETIACCIHNQYLESEKKKGLTLQDNPSLLSWDDLPENLKESNRQQAEHIRKKLEAVGCDIMLMTDWNEKLFEFSRNEIEIMAMMEHERFVEERKRDGWKVGPVKDIKKRINPTLVPWDELPEEEKNKDREVVKNLPANLAEAGFKIYRTRISLEG